MPPNRTVAPGTRPSADLKYEWYGMSPPANAPDTAKTVPISKPEAINTKSPTHICSRLLFIKSSQTLQVFSLTPRGLSVPGEHLQIVEFLGDFRFRNSIQELAHARVLARLKLFFGS